MKIRKMIRARRSKSTSWLGIGERWRIYLLRFPRAVRRDIRGDPRKRRLSFLASQIREGSSLSVSLHRHRAKLAVRFDDGTPEMPLLLPGMKWRMWK